MEGNITENEINNKCIGCGITIAGRKRKFCSKLCQSRFTSSKQYNAQKDSPIYKAKRRAYFDVWRVKNKEHFNSLLREPNKLYQRKLRESNIKNGVCLRCSQERDDKFLHCSKCRAKMRNWRAIALAIKAQACATATQAQPTETTGATTAEQQ